MMREEQLRKLDKSKWYKCNLDILPSHLKSLFVEMSSDEDTDRFIESCYQKSDWFITHLYHSVARSFLNLFMTSTSINGLLGRGSMFVYSKNQFTTLYDEVESMTSKEDSCLLDLGAGDGRVTEVMTAFFKTTYVTEVSPVMRKILSKKGYKLLDVSSWDSDTSPSFDLISCLNLLDRCDRPLDILQSMTKKVKPDGRIIIALVFPLSQYVESTSDHRAVQALNVSGETFEEQLISLENNVLIPAGLEIIKWTRLPYLCEGDLDLSFYWLHDVVIVLKKKPSESSTNWENESPHDAWKNSFCLFSHQENAVLFDLGKRSRISRRTMTSIPLMTTEMKPREMAFAAALTLLLFPMCNCVDDANRQMYIEKPAFLFCVRCTSDISLSILYFHRLILLLTSRECYHISHTHMPHHSVPLKIPLWPHYSVLFILFVSVLRKEFAFAEYHSSGSLDIMIVMSWAPARSLIMFRPS